MAGNHLTPRELQQLQRDNNKLLMAVLFLVLFAGWIAALIYLIMNGIASNVYEGFGLGAVTGNLVTLLAVIIQFFFRKSGTDIEIRERKDVSETA